MDNYSLLINKPRFIFDESFFNNIINDLHEKGFSIRKNGVPDFLIDALIKSQHSLSQQQYRRAGIGRAQHYQRHKKIRTDEICWIDGKLETSQIWLDWCEALRLYINSQLFMGLFSFESHFACYRPGDFYKPHYDAFKGESNRKLSLITYLNDDWAADNGGELVIYENDDDNRGIRVLPEKGTLVVFLSECFLHEVLPANRERHSVAGWFRVNTSINDTIDPPK